MKYAAEMGSCAIILVHITSVIKISSGIQKLMRGGIQIHRQHDDIISLLLLIPK
jgi:hypothetical protein